MTRLVLPAAGPACYGTVTPPGLYLSTRCWAQVGAGICGKRTDRERHAGLCDDHYASLRESP